MFSDHGDDVYVFVHVDLIEQLVGIPCAVVMLQDLDEMTIFNEGMICSKLMPCSRMSQEVFSGSKAYSQSSIVYMGMTMCAYCQRTGLWPRDGCRISVEKIPTSHRPLSHRVPMAQDVL